MKATLQTHQSTIINLGHNNRKIKVPHSDKEYEEKNNWYWSGNQTEEEFYNENLEPSWQKRNERQTRKDRKYDCSYLDYLKGKREKAKEIKQQMLTAGETNYKIKQATKGIKPTSHEMIVGIGNIEDNPEFGMNGDKQHIAKEILKRYYEGFNERNKGCVVLYNASIHTGENGICHGHGDFCFVSENKHGEKKISQTAALKKLGFVSDKEKGEDGKRHNAIEKWRNNERKILIELCKEYDIEIIEGKHGKKHLEKEEYINEQNKIKNEKQYNENIQMATKVIKQAQEYNEYIKKSPHGQEFKEHYENKHYQKRDNRMRSQINGYWKEYQQQSSGYWTAYKRNTDKIYNLLKDTNKDLKQTSYELDKAINNLFRFNGGILTFIYKLVTALSLFFNKKELERQANELQQLNEEIRRTRKIVSKYQNETKQALKNEDIQQIKTAIANWESKLIEISKELQYQIEIEENIITDTETLDNRELDKTADEVLK